MSRRGKSDSSALESLAAVGPFLGHGLTLAMATGLFFFVGWVVDGWLNTTPLLSILGALVGAAGGFYYLIRHLVEGGSGAKPDVADSVADEGMDGEGPG